MESTEIILYEFEQNQSKIEVLVEEETVWLTQSQMVDMFDKTKQNISLHINNCFKEKELDKTSVVKEYLTTASDGKRYKTKYYNLDVIISVWYRVKSLKGAQFRIWATQVIRNHILDGYTVNKNRLLQLKQSVKLIQTTIGTDVLKTSQIKEVVDVLSELAPHNIGRDSKRYEYVAGCLISFSCYESFKLETSYKGFISFETKTKQRAWYKENYYAEDAMGNKMFIWPDDSLQLIDKYLNRKN